MDTPPLSSPLLPRRWWIPFGIWLAIFYSIWVLLVVSGGHLSTLRDHWPIAVAMAFGSYVAGSTPMGGGTVGFPVLVLLLDQPGALGRSFGLAIQSIGMVSASIYILSRRQDLDWRLLIPTLCGSLLGTPVGAALIAPAIPDLWVKLIFAVVWASFGIMHLLKMSELLAGHPGNSRLRPWDPMIGLTIGVLGGIVSSVTGVGIDMLLYATMMLLYQADLKVSIPTSVLIMAFTSVVGIVSNLLLGLTGAACYQMDPEVYRYWLAAAPIVAVGAPLGSLVVERISRRPTLILVSMLCLVQFGWTLWNERVVGWQLIAALAGVLGFSAVFHVLYHWGRNEDVWGNPKTPPV